MSDRLNQVSCCGLTLCLIMLIALFTKPAIDSNFPVNSDGAGAVLDGVVGCLIMLLICAVIPISSGILSGIAGACLSGEQDALLFEEGDNNTTQSNELGNEVEKIFINTSLASFFGLLVGSGYTFFKANPSQGNEFSAICLNVLTGMGMSFAVATAATFCYVVYHKCQGRVSDYHDLEHGGAATFGV